MSFLCAAQEWSWQSMREHRKVFVPIIVTFSFVLLMTLILFFYGRPQPMAPGESSQLTLDGTSNIHNLTANGSV